MSTQPQPTEEEDALLSPLSPRAIMEYVVLWSESWEDDEGAIHLPFYGNSPEQAAKAAQALHEHLLREEGQ